MLSWLFLCHTCFERFLLLRQLFFLSFSCFLGPALSDKGLKVFYINFSGIRLVLVDVIAVSLGKLLQYLLFVLSLHLLLVVALLYLTVNLGVQLFFHLFGHVLMVFQL